MIEELFWDKQYRQHIGKMIAICYRYVGNRQLAEDLAHDAFLKAIEKSDTYKGIGLFEGWLRQITINTVLMYIREQKKMNIVDNPDIEITDEQDQPLDANDDNDKLNAVLKANFSQEEIIAAIQQLPERHRLVFNLYVFEKYSHKLISTTLGITVTTSKVTLVRTRKELQEILYKKTKNKILPMMILLTFIANSGKAMDRLCRNKIGNLVLAPAQPLSMTTVNWAAMPKANVSLWFVQQQHEIYAGLAIAALSSAITYGLVAPRTSTPPMVTPTQPQPIVISSDTTTTHQTPSTVEVNTQTAFSSSQQPATTPQTDTNNIQPADEAKSTDTIVIKKIRKTQKRIVIQDIKTQKN